MILDSSELIFLNVYSQDWSIKQKDGTMKDGTTNYVTVQDSADNKVMQFKLQKDYIFPNQLRPGARIRLRFDHSTFNKSHNLFVNGCHVQENNGF